MSRQAKALRLSLLLKRFKEKRRQLKAEIADLDNQISYWADNDNGPTIMPRSSHRAAADDSRSQPSARSR